MSHDGAMMPPIIANGMLRNQHRLLDGVEGTEEDPETGGDGNGHDGGETLHRTLLIFELAASGREVAGNFTAPSKFEIGHATIQIERGDNFCRQKSEEVV